MWIEIVHNIHTNTYYSAIESIECALTIGSHTYLLLAKWEVRTPSYGPSFFLPFMAKREARGPWKQGRKKRGSITCPTDWANEANKMFIIWLCWLPYILMYKSNFLDVKWAQKIDLDLYSGEHETYLPNHKKMPKFTATSQVTELSK